MNPLNIQELRSDKSLPEKLLNLSKPNRTPVISLVIHNEHNLIWSISSTLNVDKPSVFRIILKISNTMGRAKFKVNKKFS